MEVLPVTIDLKLRKEKFVLMAVVSVITSQTEEV